VKLIATKEAALQEAHTTKTAQKNHTETQTTHTVEATGLKRDWSSGFTLGPINFVAKAGETIAVFGKNGAGKSTFFQLLSGSIDRTDGDLKILGSKMNPDASTLRRRVGYLPQESTLPEWTTADEILTYAAKLLELPNPDKVVEQQLERWDAIPWRHRPICKSSHGMQRRIGLAVSMIHDPDVLILDEPFNALDIVNGRTLQQAIKERSQKGKITLISIHTPLLAAEICPRAILIEAGQVSELTAWPSLSLTARASLIETRFFGAGS
jgi:ABC-type multidrug transport system ATPase subunit